MVLRFLLVKLNCIVVHRYMKERERREEINKGIASVPQTLLALRSADLRAH